MRNSRTVAIGLILVGLLAVPAQAQVPPGRWEKVSTLSVKTSINVDFKNGDRIEGKFGGLFPSELSLRTHSATSAIPRSEIQKITTLKPDRLINGTLIGAGIGALVGLSVDAIKKKVVLYQASLISIAGELCSSYPGEEHDPADATPSVYS